VPVAARTRVSTRLQWLAEELTGQATGWQASARAQLSTVLLDLARWVAPLAVRQRPLVTQVFEVIDQKFHRPISLVDVAKAVGKSPAYLTDVVRRATRAPVGHWLFERRMAEARRLLLTTELSIAEVAERIGLDEPSYFVRRFKLLHYETPAAWRRRQRT
jgi:AraC family transcriptional regulator, transcriptional activator of pobA